MIFRIKLYRHESPARLNFSRHKKNKVKVMLELVNK